MDFWIEQPRISRTVQRVRTPATDTLVHRWRSAEQAILVGSRTVVNDDPSFLVRLVAGRQPLRVVLDRKGSHPLQVTSTMHKVRHYSSPDFNATTSRRINSGFKPTRTP